MFFVISKVVENLLLPSNAIAILAVIGGLLLLVRWRRTGFLLLSVAVVLLALVGWGPLGRIGLEALENRFPRPAIQGSVAGIIVLGGAVNIHISADRNTVATNDAGERFTAAAELARRFPDARIILSGGAGHLLPGNLRTESALGKDLLASVGVPASRIEIEEQSRNTCENAFDSKAVAGPKAGERWILVTSASHMPRAVACFRAARFPVIPYPVDYRTNRADLWQPSKSIADGLEDADLAEHEWIGLLTYHIVKGTELFPPP